MIQIGLKKYISNNQGGEIFLNYLGFLFSKFFMVNQILSFSSLK